MINSLDFFKEITKIPRPSGKEQKISAWLVARAKSLGYETKQDMQGNLLVKVAGAGNGINKDILVVQAHMDMVCEKNAGIEIDFENDGLTLYEEDGWVRARGTTLGADNGVGIALGFYIASLDDHPPLELVFTTDEEAGMTGAKNMKTGFFSGKRLLNIDGHTDEEFTVGCAGGGSSILTFNKELAKIESKYCLVFKVDGLTGGHSGLDIGLGRASAVILVLNQLKHWLDKGVEFSLSEFQGGTAHNAIARSAFARVVFADEFNYGKAKNLLLDESKNYPVEKYSNILEDGKVSFEPISIKQTKYIIETLTSLKHGVHSWSKIYDGYVETSANLASVITKDGFFKACYSYRSFIDSEVNKILASVIDLASDGLVITPDEPYPAWPPMASNKTAEILISIYKDMFKKDPVVGPVHAGLECGYMEKLSPGMQAISMGANIKDLHSPQERLQINSLKKCEILLKSFAKLID